MKSKKEKDLKHSASVRTMKSENLTNNRKLNILIVGVGGQGALTTAAIIARAAMKEGLNVLTAETHGMAQRGGSVEVHVRIGDVRSPLIPEGGADIVIALEPSEAIRYSRFLNSSTVILLNSRKIIPPSVSVGIAKYPELHEIVRWLGKVTKRIHVVNASEIAEKAGNVLATNVVVVGMLLGLLNVPLRYESVEEAVKEVLPERIIEMNLQALKMGYESVKG
jgi:indolepyruvate ferredoxin oxidoreductase beta subunit